MTITSDICQNCDDASRRFCFETKLYIRLLISLINDEGSTGPPTAWPNQAIVAFDRPYQGVQYIQKLRWRKSQIFCEAWFNMTIFSFFGGNWEGSVGSPTAWKNKRPRPVAVLIPGYNIYKICDDASLSYFRRIFWISLFRHFPDSLDVGFGGSYPRPLRLPGPNGDTKLLIWPLPLIYVETAMTQVLDFVLRPNCTFACWFLL